MEVGLGGAVILIRSGITKFAAPCHPERMRPERSFYLCTKLGTSAK